MDNKQKIAVLEQVSRVILYVMRGGHVVPEDKTQLAICVDTLENVIAEMKKEG